MQKIMPLKQTLESRKMENRDDRQDPAKEPSTTKGKDDPVVVEGYNNGSIKRAKLQLTLEALLQDPILSDLPKNPTLSDVNTFISLELGSAIRISILKLDSSTFDVAVMNTATVKDLKMAVKKKVVDLEQSQMGHRQISWKHVWANFCLSYHSQKLLDDSSRLQDHGIRNNSQLLHSIIRVFSEKHGPTTSERRIRVFEHGYSYNEKLVIPAAS